MVIREVTESISKNATSTQDVVYDLQKEPVVGTDIVVTYGNSKTVTFVAGTSSTKAFGTMGAANYNGDKKLRLSSDGTSTVTWRTVQYVAQAPTYGFIEDKSKVEIKETKSYETKLEQIASIPANSVADVFFSIGNSVSYSSLMGVTEIHIDTTASNFSILGWYAGASNVSNGYIVRIRNNSSSQINLTTESFVRFIYK